VLAFVVVVVVVNDVASCVCVCVFMLMVEHASDLAHDVLQVGMLLVCKTQ
jgi:hypothetical protein